MTALGFPYPLVLDLIAGALEFVPVVGWIIASAIVLTFGWLAHAHWIWMAAVIAGWQTVLNLVIWPRIMGDRLQMEPITVMFALMASGQVGGLLGAVLSVPAAAVVRIVWLEHKARRNAPGRVVVTLAPHMHSRDPLLDVDLISSPVDDRFTCPPSTRQCLKPMNVRCAAPAVHRLLRASRQII